MEIIVLLGLRIGVHQRSGQAGQGMQQPVLSIDRHPVSLDRAGTSSGHKLTPCTALYVIAGHELWHVKSIKENYLA